MKEFSVKDIQFDEPTPNRGLPPFIIRAMHASTGLCAIGESKISRCKAETDAVLKLTEMHLVRQKKLLEGPSTLTLILERDSGNARCNFCDGPMPCNCPPPDNINEIIDRDLIARAKYSDLLDERD